jgi:archaellum component FlaF (FlaF/FlaG flagellin family)
MKGDASSANAAAPLWNKVMKYLENGQKPKPFVTDGLISITIDPSTGFQNRNGASEWVTPAQKKILDDAKAKMASPDYVASTKNIFENRTSLLSKEIQINKLDGKLATAQTLPENIEKKICIQLLPEFPTYKNWADPVNAVAGDKYCKPPSEKSTQDQISEKTKVPNIVSNLDSNTSNISLISLNASVQGDSSKTISKLEILVDGSSVKSSANTSSLDFDTTGLNVGPHTVTLRATDNFGASISKDYSNVTFGNSSPLAATDISGLNVICPLIVNSSSAITCSFVLPSNKTLPSSFKLGVGDSVPAGVCSASGQSVSCSNVPTGTTTGTSVKIFGQIGSGTPVDTGKTVNVI